MRVAVYTLGCKVNQFESFVIEEEYRSRGCELVSWKDKADIYVVNTCAVTSKAAYQSRQILRRLKRLHPQAKIIATGCHVQTDPGQVISSVGPGICLAGNNEKLLLVARSLEKSDKSCTGVFVSDILQQKEFLPMVLKQPPRKRTRVFLKIQDGCNSFCSYCIVPYARGRSRSMDQETLFKQVEILAEKGVKEIVLTGIHLGLYGRDLQQPTDLYSVVKRLCSKFQSVNFRLSSIEPKELHQGFWELVTEFPNFCPHFHIPLQSGSDKVLSAMNRNYSASFFSRLIISIKEKVPNCSIGTDVMTGFPIEQEEDFEKTFNLLKSLPISYLHAFPYSPRPGTRAWYMKPLIGKKEAKKRVKRLIELGIEKKRQFFSQFVDNELLVLIERQVKAKWWEGHSLNYIPIRVESDLELSNRLVQVKILGLLEKGDFLGLAAKLK